MVTWFRPIIFGILAADFTRFAPEIQKVGAFGMKEESSQRFSGRSFLGNGVKRY
jgi:hypothetical protein